MKITKAQAVKLGQELEKMGWCVFDSGASERVCCGEERDENENFCSDCGKKLFTKITTDDDTVNQLIQAVSRI